MFNENVEHVEILRPFPLLIGFWSQLVFNGVRYPWSATKQEKLARIQYCRVTILL